MNAIAYIGTYTRSTSMGIYAFRYEAESGQLELMGRAADAVNPSFLTLTPGGRFLYAVNEAQMLSRQPGGSVSAFRIERDGGLALLNKVNSGGAHPCHLTADRTGRWLFVANYTGGSVAVFPIGEDGALGGAVQVVEHAGASMADPARQEGPHAHSVDISHDNRFLYVCDLGLDRIVIYAFDAASGRLAPHQRVETAGGAGPRHLAFLPEGTRAYVFNELNATITAYRVDSARGGLAAFQTVSTLPDGYHGKKWGAEIVVHPSGEFLWASNRAHDSIASFRIAPEDGRPVGTGHVATEGVQPRHFALDPAGRFLHVANAESGTVVPFHVDLVSGALEVAGPPVAVPEPVCVVFVSI